MTRAGRSPASRTQIIRLSDPLARKIQAPKLLAVVRPKREHFDLAACVLTKMLRAPMSVTAPILPLTEEKVRAGTCRASRILSLALYVVQAPARDAARIRL